MATGDVPGTGGSLAGDPAINAQQQQTRTGFASAMRSFTSAVGNISKLNEGVDKLVRPNDGTIAKLTKALDDLTTRLNSVAAGGGGGNAASTSGPSGGTNPHGGFGTAVLAASAFTVGGLANIVGSKQAESLGMAPSATSLQMPGGLSYKQVNNILSNRTLSYGTQGGADTLAAAQQAQYISGRAMLAPGNRMMDPTFRNTMGNISQIALTNPGMSLTEAGSMYASLRTPRVNWWSMGLGFPSFTGQGRTSPSFAGQATSYLQALLPGATAQQQADPRFLFNQFTGNQSAAAAGRQFLGGDAQLQTVLNAATANLQYRQATGNRRGDIFSDIQGDNTGRYINRRTGQYTNAGWRQYEKEAKLGGYSNDVISGERNLQNLDSKNALIYSSSQETNIGRMLAVQIDMRQYLQNISRAVGQASPILGPMDKAFGAVKNPLTDLLLLNMLGKGGGLGGTLGKIGARIPGGAAAGDWLAGLGGPFAGSALGTGGLLAGGALAAGVGGFGVSNAIPGHVHGAGGKALGVLGGAGTGALIGAGVGSIVPGIGTGIGAAAGGVIGGIGGLLGDAPMGGGFIIPELHPHIGDAPPTDDISILQSRNMTGNPGEVTGLNKQFRHDLACMFRDNPNLVLNSGFRDNAKQKELYDKYLKYGGPPVAPPGSSMHNKGLAADIGPKSQEGWLHSHGGKYGLVNFTEEAWHWELAGASNAGNRSNYGVAPDPKVCKGLASGGAASGGGSSAPSSGSLKAGSGAITAGGIGSGGLYPGNVDPMRALIGSGTEAGARKFVGQTTVDLSTPAGSGDTSGGGAADSSAAGGTVFASGSLEDRFLAFVRQHESGGNYKSPSGPGHWAGGAYQIMHDTWARYGGYDRADQAPPKVQDAKAREMLKSIEGVVGNKDPGLWAAAWYLGTGGAEAWIRGGMDPNYAPPENNGFKVKTYYDQARHAVGLGDAPMGPSYGGSADFLRSMRGGSVGDAPTAVPGARPMSGGVALVGGARTINASFTVNVKAATQNEAETFAQYAWKRIKQLEAQDAQRSN